MSDVRFSIGVRRSIMENILWLIPTPMPLEGIELIKFEVLQVVVRDQLHPSAEYQSNQVY
jgi:hypothetical protein